MNDNLQELYNNLRSLGYTSDELGNEENFRQSMSDKDKRKDLYDYIKGNGHAGDWSYEDYEAKYGGGQTAQPKQPQPQPQPQETTQPAQTNAEVETTQAQAQEKAVEKPQQPTAPNEVSPKDDKDNKGFWGRMIDNAVKFGRTDKYNPAITAPSYAVPQLEEDRRIKQREEEREKKQAEYDAMPTGVSGNDWGQFTDEWNNFVEESARLNEDIAKAKGKSEEGGRDLLHPNWDELGNKEGFLDKDTWAIRNEERKREDELLKQREQYVRQMLKGQQVFKEQGGTDKPIEIEQDGKKVYLTSGGYTTDDKAVAQLATTQYNDAVNELEAQTKSTKEQVGDLLESINKGLEERKGELESKLQENFEKNPLATSVTLEANPNYFVSDPTVGVYNMAQHKLEQVQNFIRIAEKYRDDDIGFLKGFGYGAFDKATDIGTYDFGLSDLSGALAAYDILKKTEKGEKLKPEEEALLDAYALEYAARMEYAQYIGRGYGAGAQAVDFGVLAAQLAVNPLKGAGAGAEKAFANWLEKKGINYAERNLAGYATRFATRAVTSTLPAAGLSLLQTPEWMAAGIEGTMDFQTNGGEALPQETDTGAGVYYSNEGRRTQIKGGIARSDKSLAQSIGQSYKSQLIGNWAMMMVPATGEVTGAIGKGLVSSAEKATPKVVADYISKVGTQEAVRGFDSFLKAVDIPKRSFDFYASMQLGNILDAATPGGQEFRNEEGTGVFNLDRQVDEYVNALMFETAMGAARGVSYGWGRYQLGRQFDAQYQNMEAGTWRNKQAQLAELIKKFESGDEQQTADAIKSLFADQSLTKEQIEDAVKLGGLSAQRHFCERMFNETFADLRANENATGRRIQQGLESNFNEGLGIVNPNLRIDKDGNVTEATGDEAVQVTRNSAAAQEAWGKYNIHRQEILDMCGKDVLAQLDENPQGTLRTMRNTGVDAVTLQACEEYVNAKAKVDGIGSALGQEATVSAINAAQAIRMRQQQDGMLHHATLEDGRKVDILGETGTSATVIDENGDKFMVPMSEIASLDGTESVDDLLKQSAQRINEQAQATEQQLLKPLLQFEPGDVYDIELPDGSRGNVVVIGEMNEKGETTQAGSVFVMMPDSSVEELSMDYIQQQWDMTRSEDWASEINERRRRQIEQENAGEVPDQWKPRENEPTEPTEPENTATEEPAEGEGEAEGAEGTTEAEGGTETPAEQPEQRTYTIGDKVQIVDDQGNIIDAEVTQVHPDGTLIVEYEGGQKPYTQEALNEAEAEAKEAQQPTETPTETPAETPAEQPATEDSSATETPAEEPQQQSALEQLPKKENGKPDFNKAQNASQLVDAMTEFFKGDKQKAKRNIAATLGGSQAELRAAQEALDAFNEAVDNLGKPSKGKKGKNKEPQIKLSSDPDENAELQLSLEDAVEKAQQKVEYWQAGIDEITRREEAEKQAVIDQLNAEQAQLAQSQELKDVPEMNEDRPADARARGFRRVNGQKVERQQPINKIEGKEVNVKFSSDTKQAGHVALVEADQLQPSHTNDGRNPQHFLDEAQPKERTDQASKMGKSDIAKNINPEEITGSITAYTGAPSVNARGEAIQGNNRAAALKEMWRNHPEQAQKYKQYLKDHASEFGLTPEQIDQMKNPVLVNMLDVDDETAIKMGQFTASDTETGGVERIKPQNAREKLGNSLSTFARMLMDTDDPDDSIAAAISKNAPAVLHWMNKEGYITPTQYASATNRKGYITEEAKADLRNILYECVFEGANPALRQKFGDMPVKAQKAILSTIWRDGMSPASERMTREVQRAIDLYDLLSKSDTFSDAKTEEQIRNAVRGWYLQTQFDEVTGETYLPKDKFSNFAVELATLFKAKSQKELTNLFNRMYDLIQGSDQLDLFNENRKFSLEEAIKETLGIDYDGKKRGTTLDSDHPAGEGGEQGESGNSSGGEPSPQGEGAANGAGGAQGNAEATVTEPPRTRTATQEKKAKERRQSVESEVKKMTDALGTTVRILDSIDQVRDPKIRKAIEAGEKTGEKVTGWYDPVTGEVVVYYPNLTDVNEAKLTYLHEVVGHKGLRALFGDKFEDTMKDVYRSLPKKLQESIQKRMDKKSFKAQGYADPLVASVEEELSNWAEKNKKPSWWDKIVANVRDKIRSVVDLEMTDADIDYLLWRSRNNLENQTLQQRATDRVLEQRARKANAEVLFSVKGERPLKSLGRNQFGYIYDWKDRDPMDAFEFLKRNGAGYLRNVFHRDDIGYIDLVWGDKGKGLAHIINKHVLEYPDFASQEDAMNTITDIINDNSITAKRGKKGRLNLDKGDYRVVIAQDNKGNWILTAFDKTTPSEEKRKGAAAVQTPGQPAEAEGAGAVTPSLSESKVTTSSETTKENGEKSSETLFREKETDRQKMTPKQLDEEYFDAMERGDEERMREIIDEVARRKGYDADESWRQYATAPNRNKATPVGDGTLYAWTLADEVSDNPNRANSLSEAIRHSVDINGSRGESMNAIQDAMSAIRNGEDPMVTIYRAVPKGVEESKMRVGDWVTMSRAYAEAHGENIIPGEYRIIEEKVPASQLYWDGNDINEWGFDDGKEYRYKNTKNNRKLNDLVTRDEDGNVIPPSKRFNERNASPLFRTREKQQAHERAQEISDEAEKRIYDKDKALEQRRINSLAQELGINGYTLPENADLDNTEGMVVREAARQGTLKDSLGERWDEFLKKVYQNTDEETLKDINEFARQNGWNFAEATERYLASLADNGAFEQAVERGMWDGVKSAFNGALEGKGFEFGAEDNDIRYALWRNEQNKSESPNSTLLARATEVATNNALSNENSPMFRTRQDNPNDPKVLYRNGVNEPAEVARIMEFKLSHQTGLRGWDWLKHWGSRRWFQMAEAWQDSMQALYEFMKACEGDNWKGEAEVADYMNPYTRENRLSSKNEDDINVFARKFLSPMFDEAKKLAKNDRERRLLNNYIISKHGLERNEYMAEREARNAFEKQSPDASWDDLPDEVKDALVSQARRDFAGLTGLFGLKGEEWQQAEAEARELVENYETAHDTERLWKTINATSESILKKQLDTGLISKETYDKIKGMYKYYVPLRGFEEKTTDDVYAYLNYQRGEFNNPIQKASGRTSLANDPFESLASMAQSGIIYGNRNELVKQAFYNFVKAHPSDYVTESPLWLRKGEDGEWEAVFCNTLRDGDSPDVVSQKLAEFERTMKQAQEEHPDMYATGKQAHSLPYKMPDKGRISEHQVVVRIGGKDKVLTVNGSPRLVQAINGKTNPDVPQQGWQQAMNKWSGNAVRFLSQVHTTWNPDFIISNYLRDVGYSNVMAWIKENGIAPEYAGMFTANTAQCNPGTILTLLEQRRRGTLNTKKELGKYFEEFMANGGETGYARMQDRDKIAKEIKKKLHVGVSGTVGDAVDAIGEIAGEFGRSVELSQRFAAFVTSRESGRGVGRSIYDAKEITVNFNKKGAGSTFYGANGQTMLGNIASFVSGVGRDLFMFWNAGVQGTTNIARNTFRNKQSMAKAATAFGTLMLLGYMNSMYGGGDEDKEKKSIEEHGDSYWDLPTYTRRTNFCFRDKGGWTTIPISIELRLAYGMGEIMGSYARGHEKNKDLVWDVGDLLGHVIFPVNFLEGQEAGSHDFFMPLVPSPFRPAYEAARNRSWSGRRIYSPDMPWNEGEPRYQRAYRNTDKVYIGLSKGINSLTGGDEFERGWGDWNCLSPEALQYMFQQYAPFYVTANQGLGLYKDVTGQKDFSWRDVPIVNRIKKDSGEQLHQQAVSRDYWENKKDVDALINRVKEMEKKERYDEADEIMDKDEYWNAEDFQGYEQDVSDAMKDASDPDLTDEERKEAQREVTRLQEEANATLKQRSD